VYTGRSASFASALAATGVVLPFGWIFVLAIVAVVVGYLLVRYAVRAQDRRRAPLRQGPRRA